MPISITVVSPASAEPITLDEAKRHLREDGSDQDELITGLIVAAREYVEGGSDRVLMPQTVRQYFDDFPCDGEPMRLSVHPIRSVSAIGYIDSDGDEITLDASDYRVDSVSTPARITPAFGETWPTSQGVINGVYVNVAAGYSDAASVPRALRQAILLLIGHWYENREAATDFERKEVPLAVQSLIARWSVYTQ